MEAGMRALTSFVASIFFVSLPLQATGATMSYFFAGSPFLIANYPSGSGPLMRTGSLTIDLAGLPGGSPAGQRVASQIDFAGYDEEQGWYPLETTPGFVSVTMDRERSSRSRCRRRRGRSRSRGLLDLDGTMSPGASPSKPRR
jgi:hypothetical protein